MKEQLKRDILDFLDIREENNFSDLELFRLLDKKRKTIHPDRTTDEDVKKEYETKIKTANNLYSQLGEILKNEKENLNSLQIYDNEISIDYVEVKIENENLKNQIKKLQSETENLRNEIETQNNLIKSLNDKKIDEETEKLKDFFKPKTNSIIILGVVALTGFLIKVISNTEEAMNFYLKYLPFLKPQTINYIILSALILITIIFLISYFKKVIISNWTDKIKSTEFNSNIYDFVKDESESERHFDYDFDYRFRTYYFGESTIYNFVKKTFDSKSKILTLIRKIIGLNTFSIYENLKKIIIYNLLNKNIIKIDGNIKFEKRFKTNK